MIIVKILGLLVLVAVLASALRSEPSGWETLRRASMAKRARRYAGSVDGWRR